MTYDCLRKKSKFGIDGLVKKSVVVLPFMVRYPFDVLRAVSQVEAITTNGKPNSYGLYNPFALSPAPKALRRRSEVSKGERDFSRTHKYSPTGSKRKANLRMKSKGESKAPVKTEKKDGAPEKAQVSIQPSRWTNIVIKEGISIAKKIGAAALLFYMDSTKDIIPLTKIKSDIKLIVLTKRKECVEKAAAFPIHAVVLPEVQLTRSGYLKIGFLSAMSKGLLKSGDVIVCVGGIPEQGYMDTIMLIEVSTESQLFSGAVTASFLSEIRSDVFETLLGIVLELANEGREGKPVGSIFVLGDHEKVLSLSSQLVFNPFHGHPEEALNINEPQMRESLKEFSSIDGAFVIREDGVVLAAGRYLNVGYHGEALPQGLGTRHAAAAAITQATNSVALTISESTGKVTLFKGGKILTEIEKAPPVPPRVMPA
jgi:diadenylate cyclase